MSEYNDESGLGPAPTVPAAQPRRVAEPETVVESSPRREAMAFGTGAVAMAGLAAVGLTSLLGGCVGDTPKSPKKKAPKPTDNLEESSPILGSPPAAEPDSAAIDETASASPNAPAEAGSSAPGASPDETGRRHGQSGQEASLRNRRVVHDPRDIEMSLQTQATVRKDIPTGSGSRADSGLKPGQKSGTTSTTPPTPGNTPAPDNTSEGSGQQQGKPGGGSQRGKSSQPKDDSGQQSQAGGKKPQPKANGNTQKAPRLAEVDPSKAYQAAPASPSQKGSSPLAPNLTLKTTPAWHMARRAAIAATADIVADIEAQGIQGWLDRQLDPASIDDSKTEWIIKSHFPWSVLSAAKIAAHGQATHRVGPQVRNALVMRARFTKRVLLENVVDVLANHIYVPTQNKATIFVGELDQLLRQYALGRYADLLHATLTHPALLVELDNQVNTKANPNENLGRELLELYTVGVGNYNETDVRQSALLLTGHGLDWKNYTYKYNPGNHHTGAVKVMEFSDENADAQNGPQLLRNYVEHLAKHEKTAERLARRFAVRFISDSPKDETVKQLAKAYLDNDTSIKALVKATLTHPDFNASTGLKWRRPMELVCSIARAAQVQNVTPAGRLGANDEYDTGMYGWLIELGGHLPRNWPVVDGYPDTADYWNSASVGLTMLNATQDAVEGDKKESGITSWSKVLGIKVGDKAMEVAKRITWHLTGYEWTDKQVATIANLLMSDTPATADSTMPAEDLDYWVSQAVRVIFASPYGSLR